MVCLAVPRFGFEPEVCLARPLLLEALAAYERGDYVGAGVRLRESLRRFVVAACRWYAVDLTRAMRRDKFARIGTLIKALRQAKASDELADDIMRQCVEVGNAAAHCRPFDVDSLRGCIALLFTLLDSEPYSAMRDRQPVIAVTEPDDCCCDFYDDDDPEDGSDWWKPSDWTPGL